MGGDIEIVEQSNGLQGTRFKFTIFLVTQKDIGSWSEELLDHKHNKPNSVISTCVHSPATSKSSKVILFIKNDGRRNMVHRYMESLGFNLEVLSHWRQLSSTLKKLKSKLIDNSHGTHLGCSPDFRRRGGPKFLPEVNNDDVLPVYKRSRTRESINCILLVIDCNVGDDFRKLQRLVSEFRKDLYMSCVKVVWLERPETRGTHFQGLQDGSLPPTDHIMLDPLHGSRLLRVVSLLPEFGGDLIRSDTDYYQRSDRFYEAISTVEPLSRKQKEAHGEIMKIDSLEGIKVLIVEDHHLQRKLAETCLARLGAQHRTCTNGKEAVEVVCQGLSNLQSQGHVKFSYDLILMDCQMPIMDGFEASRRIRDEEKKYGLHIPIIALTAHEVDGEEGIKIAEAGMDFHLTKPLQPQELLKLVNSLLLG